MVSSIHSMRALTLFHTPSLLPSNSLRTPLSQSYPLPNTVPITTNLVVLSFRYISGPPESPAHGSWYRLSFLETSVPNINLCLYFFLLTFSVTLMRSGEGCLIDSVNPHPAASANFPPYSECRCGRQIGLTLSLYFAGCFKISMAKSCVSCLSYTRFALGGLLASTTGM